MARTYGYALLGALLATFTVTPGALASYLLPEHVEEAETFVVRVLLVLYTPVLRWSLSHRKTMIMIAAGCLALFGLLVPRLGSEFLPALGRRQSVDPRHTAADDIARSRHADRQPHSKKICAGHPEVITVVSQHGRPDNGSDAAGFNNAEFFIPLKPFEDWAPE